MTDPALVAVLAIIFVAVAASVFDPGEFLGHWRLLAAAFEIHSEPTGVTFDHESVFFDQSSAPWWKRLVHSGEYIHFDVRISSDGLGLVYRGPVPARCPRFQLIPWARIESIGENGTNFFFNIRAAKELQMMTGQELGVTILRRVS